jgi:hypothetical protein
MALRPRLTTGLPLSRTAPTALFLTGEEIVTSLIRKIGCEKEMCKAARHFFRKSGKVDPGKKSRAD